MTTLRRSWVDTRLGRFLVVGGEHGLCLLVLNEERAQGELARWIERNEPRAEVAEDPGDDLLVRVRRQLLEWGEGRRRSFDLPLDLRGTPFQLRCWAELQRIPHGQTRTYGELARRVGRPGASRAVGGANGANPVPVIVPCHRVVAARGLGGFGGGLELKRRLLEHEGALLAYA